MGLAVVCLANPGLLAGQVVIPQFHDEMNQNLTAGQQFRTRIRTGTI